MYDQIQEGFFSGVGDGLRVVLAVVVGLAVPLLIFSPWFWLLAVAGLFIWQARERKRAEAPRSVSPSHEFDWAPIRRVLDELEPEDFERLRARRRCAPVDEVEARAVVTQVTGVAGVASDYARSVGATGDPSANRIHWDRWVWWDR